MPQKPKPTSERRADKSAARVAERLCDFAPGAGQIAPVTPSGKELTELCASLLESDEFIARYVLRCEKVKRAVIDEYLRSFTRTPPVMSSGVAALAPLPKAKTLEEARTLCERYLNGM